MLMKKFALGIALSFGFLTYGQQDPQFTHYMFNTILYNPGYAGLNGAICANALMREQWTGLSGRPSIYGFSIEAPVDFLGGGLGLNLVADKLGNQYYNDIKINYSYHLEMGQGKLGIGLNAGFTDLGIRINDAWKDPNGGTGGGDPSIPQADQNSIVPDIGLGLYYATTDWYVGLSSTHLLEFSADLSTVQYGRRRHIYLTGGYNWELTPELTIVPSTLIKSDQAAMTFDLTGIAIYNNKLYGGVNYRLQDAVSVLLGYNVTEQLRAGYSYDIGTSKLSGFNNGTHELFVSYCFTIEVPPKTPQKYRNVRFL